MSNMKGRMMIALGLAAVGALNASAQMSPYAGEETASIKALSSEERAALLAGKGMGFAKAAELNGYPGPSHVLELASQLELTPSQLASTQALFTRMQEAARADGAALIEAERGLDALYSKRTATAENVDAQLISIESIRARLRGIHLKAHLDQAAMLTPHQLVRYSQLRGYGAAEQHGNMEH